MFLPLVKGLPPAQENHNIHEISMLATKMKKCNMAGFIFLLLLVDGIGVGVGVAVSKERGSIVDPTPDNGTFSQKFDGILEKAIQLYTTVLNKLEKLDKPKRNSSSGCHSTCMIPQVEVFLIKGICLVRITLSCWLVRKRQFPWNQALDLEDLRCLTNRCTVTEKLKHGHVVCGVPKNYENNSTCQVHGRLWARKCFFGVKNSCLGALLHGA